MPSQFGIGDLGPQAFAFVDFLREANQTIWQVLPLNPPARGNSPYSCYSVFAINPTLVSPAGLHRDGWLPDLPPATPASDGVNFSAVAQQKHDLLESAFAHTRDRLKTIPEFAEFCESNAWWLNEFARFEALMRAFKTSDWTTWPSELANCTPTAVATWEREHSAEVTYSKFVQFLLDQQWTRLKRYASEQKVRLYGDLSIFVAHESADVWANQPLFHLDSEGQPTLVAGVPPDYFSATGQRWGNPLYRWDVMESNDFAWWTKRFRRAQEQFELLRVDHFRGFESYWEIPASAETAVDGEWQPGPGTKPFEAAQAALGELPLIAEDLGLITKEVHELRDQLGFPPMRVLQFGFDSEKDVFHRPCSYPEHCVAYTGTHDNNTLVGWYREREKSGDVELINQFVDANQDVAPQLIELLFASDADTVILPLQDVLGLGAEARMNQPGTATGNWGWRVQEELLTDTIAGYLRRVTEKTSRTFS